MAWAHAAGYHVGEHPAYGGVTRAVHTRGSWHNDGLAADINWGTGSPPSERKHLLVALQVAESMGLALIYARDGTTGVAANHRHHLHVDVGEWSNYGRGNVRRRSGNLKVWQLQGTVRTPAGKRDNLWGPDTDKRLRAVRAASRLGGVKFPYGVKYTQRIVGTHDDGDWGGNSRAAHDATVKRIQRALGVRDDGWWGPKTDSAYERARKTYIR
jgi:hypothetical protein